MKKIGLIAGILLLESVIAVVAADPSADYDPKPLPSGPILRKAPDFSQWQIAFSYQAPKSPDGSSVAPSAAGNPALRGSHLPSLLTVTRTKPRWHSVLVDVSGEKKELWFDGSLRYQVGPKDTDVIPIAAFSPTYSAPFLDYSTGPDFPDVAWVSANTYLGTQKGTNDWVFQQAGGGAMVWIDSTTRFPVRWQKGQETRTFQFFDAPSAPIALPAKVSALSRGLKHLHDLSHAAPPQL